MAVPTHSDGTNGHFGDGGVAARKSNQNFLSVDRGLSHQRIGNAHRMEKGGSGFEGHKNGDLFKGESNIVSRGR